MAKAANAVTIRPKMAQKYDQAAAIHTYWETMAYDAAGRLLRHTSATGAVTIHGYDFAGRLVKAEWDKIEEWAKARPNGDN
jgi:YD repeat-containing protein